MVINQQLAQKLVDKIMDNLGYNINIMNDEGIIIASGNQERVGTYHTIAKEVIKKNKTMVIYKDDEVHYKGVRAGINMPFFFKDQLAGVIGITGDPDEIQNAAELVRMATEVMLDQEFLKERIFSHQSQKTFFINRLLNISEEEVGEIKQWGTRLGYNMDIPRVVCLISLHNIKALSKTSPLYSSANIRNNILSLIKESKLHSKEDISAYINVNEIIIFKSIYQTQEYRETIQKYVEEIYNSVRVKYSIEWNIVVGTYHEGILGLQKGFEEAGVVRNLETDKQLVFSEDYQFEYLISRVPQGYMDHFLKEKYLLLVEDEQLLKTVLCLVENNMCIKEAADRLYVHRNTMNFRMKKIKELFGIDPFNNEEDRQFLWLLVMYIKLYGEDF